MNESEARDAVLAAVGADATARLNRLARMVVSENDNQNLIAKSTIPSIWTRHIWDSIQLLRWAPRPTSWLDVGTGAGFPGLAIACAVACPMTLVEPRRRRAEFLGNAARELGLDHVTVFTGKVDRAVSEAAIITARAVGGIDFLLRSTLHCATPDARWLLPRGSISQDEWADMRRQWKGMFHVEQSLSNPAASILVVDGLQPR